MADILQGGSSWVDGMDSFAVPETGGTSGGKR